MTIFADQAAAVADFRARYANAPQLGLAQLADPIVLDYLKVAERQVANRLRIFLEPTWVFAEGATDAEITARTPANSPYVMDPGYDYNPDFFRDNRWGYLVTRRRPILSVESWRFVYSAGNSVPLFQVPQDWLRVDRKYGHIRLVPVGSEVTLPLSSYLLSVYGGGRTIPHMVRLTYRAGIADIGSEYPDLLNFIKRVAALNRLRDAFPANSASISADGLSQSKSFDINTHIGVGGKGGGIEAEFDAWLQVFHGVRLAVV